MKAKIGLVGIVLAGLLLGGGSLSRAQTNAPSLPPGVQDVVKLQAAGMSDDIIISQIKNTPANYNLSVDQIIYLKNQGVSQNVIKALMSSGNGAAPAAPAVPSLTPSVAPTPAAPPAIPNAPTVPSAPGVPPPPSVDPAMAAYQSQLTPYGAWVQVPGYGLCWQPTVAATDPFWRPYLDGGYWDYTADGWSWQSEYPWGATVFHYGRWVKLDGGWFWVPGYDYGPAWVTWRERDGYYGWAPLPPEATFKAGVGLWYHGGLALDVDFGLGPSAFTFVAYDHFWDHHLRSFAVPRERVDIFFHESHVLNGYRFANGRFFVDGPGHDRVFLSTHRDWHHDEYRFGDPRFGDPHRRDDHWPR